MKFFIIAFLFSASAHANQNSKTLADSVNSIFQTAGGNASRVRLIGTDQNGRLCEASLTNTSDNKTISLAFDRNKKGMAEYFDLYFDLHRSESLVNWKYDEKNGLLVIEDLDYQTKKVVSKVELQLTTSFDKKFYDGSLVLTGGSQNRVCRFQRLINDQTSEAYLLLREGLNH